MEEEWTKLDQSRGCGGFAADKRCRPDLGDGDGAGVTLEENWEIQKESRWLSGLGLEQAVLGGGAGLQAHLGTFELEGPVSQGNCLCASGAQRRWQHWK